MKLSETERGALEAANRIMHGGSDENDIQLVAGVLFYLLSGPDEEFHQKIGCWCEPRAE